MPTSLKAGGLYFALTFAAGFALGVVRELWMVPRVGVRTAELIEAPVMLVVCILAARWTVRRLTVPPAALRRLAMGLSALVLLLAAELAMIVGVRHLSLVEYAARRDPLSGVVYLLLLAIFAVMPLVVARR